MPRRLISDRRLPRHSNPVVDMSQNTSLIGFSAGECAFDDEVEKRFTCLSVRMP